MTRRPSPPPPPPPSKRGGRRAGAGAPRAKLPPDILARLGEPPVEDPLAMMRWWSKLLGLLTWLRLQGAVAPRLLEDVRAIVNAAKSLVPEDLRAEVYHRLRELDRATASSSQVTGATPEPVEPAAPTQALQGRPR